MKMSEQLNEILDIVCTYHQVEIEDIKGPGRNRELVSARQMFCSLAKKLTRHTVTSIGEKINRDHSTVSYSHKIVDTLLEYDKFLQYDYDTIFKIFPNLHEIKNIMKNNFKVYKTSDMVGAVGTYKVGTIIGTKYLELVKALGEPTVSVPSGDNKVQVEWIIDFNDDRYTIYDWKTYDRVYTIDELNTWSVGGKKEPSKFIERVNEIINTVQN
jgi:hypothetical protein